MRLVADRLRLVGQADLADELRRLLGAGVEAEVVSSAYFGGQTLVTARLRDADGSLVSAATTSQTPPETGAVIRVAVQGNVMAYPATPAVKDLA